jgi:hypothetical protein
MPSNSLGGKLGMRWAAIQERHKLLLADKMTPIIVKHGMSLQHEFYRLTGSELRATIGPMYRRLAETPGIPDAARDTFTFLANGRGQWATMLGGIVTGAALGGGLSDIFANWLRPTSSFLMREDPNQILVPADAAAASIRGVQGAMDMRSEAASNGIAEDRFQVLQELASQVLNAEYITELLNRELIDATRAAKYFQRAGWDPDHSDWLFKLRHSLVSIQDAAAMRNRSIITPDELRTIARHNGFTDQIADQFDLLAGAPPDLETLFLAWRRGVITEADVDRGIVEGPLRNEWIPAVKELQWIPLPPQEAANAVNQGHLDLSVATKKAEESGIRPADFAIMIENAGIPPGPMEALTWISRGLITEDQFRTIFLESRIKNKYIDLYLAARPEQLTFAEIRSLSAKGVIPKEAAIIRLMERGYTADDSAFILAGASAEKTAKVRDLTVAQVITLYQDRLISLDAALSMLEAMGYEPQEAQWYVDIANLQRAVRSTTTATSHIHSLYVAYRIDAGQASAALDRLQIPPDARDDLMALWLIEHDASTRDLSAAEIIHAAKLKIMLSGPAYTRLQGIGYDASDALVKLKLGGILLPTDTVEALAWPNP